MPDRTAAQGDGFPAFYLARWHAMTAAERRAMGVRDRSFMDAARAAFLEQEATTTKGAHDMPRKPGRTEAREETRAEAGVREELEALMAEVGLDPATLAAKAKARKKRFR